MQVVAAVSAHGEPIAEAGACLVLASTQLAHAPAFDVAIDFSLPDGFGPLVALCVERGAALVSGTTGLSERQREVLQQAADKIALLWSANFSVGVAVLSELVQQAAAAVPGWDADIVESHHRHKVDAPSGTALQLGAAVARGRGSEPHYASLRAGDIVGEHLVQFSGEGERLELCHRASNRDIFARGALEAAWRLSRCTPGEYLFGRLLLAAPGA